MTKDSLFNDEFTSEERSSYRMPPLVNAAVAAVGFLVLKISN